MLLSDLPQVFLSYFCVLEVPMQISHSMKKSLTCYPMKDTGKHEN